MKSFHVLAFATGLLTFLWFMFPGFTIKVPVDFMGGHFHVNGFAVGLFNCLICMFDIHGRLFTKNVDASK